MMVGVRQVHTLTGHSEDMQSVAFSPNGNRVVSVSKDNRVKIWNAETGALVSSFVSVARWRGYCLGVPRRFCICNVLKQRWAGGRCTR